MNLFTGPIQWDLQNPIKQRSHGETSPMQQFKLQMVKEARETSMTAADIGFGVDAKPVGEWVVSEDRIRYLRYAISQAR